ncbi:MAG: 23S rRNA (adenine(2503)-C(2))-methyltransferase RlmN [Parcubacteria group bacterium]|nr:23S rRNA (adenine(2503)-C(2))-methyltransferase RlmN [Parcubacteria group bacterium]
MREKIEKEVEWISVKPLKILTSKANDTHKVLLETIDKESIESVLMKNARNEWTICVSSQIGCPIGCTFCATGSMGFKRNLLSDEIIDQYRFWSSFLEEHNLPGRISNVVFMGMGEPFLNYENVKNSLHALIELGDLGTTKIVVSTVGIFPEIEKILKDKDWPNVRIAISLHAPNLLKRKKLIPTTPSDFFEKLIGWSKEYTKTLGNRRHYITFEYLLLDGVNDSTKDAEELSKLIPKTGLNKVNIIPYNTVLGKPLKKSQQENIKNFKLTLSSKSISVTERRSLGEDINAACGQLTN